MTFSKKVKVAENCVFKETDRIHSVHCTVVSEFSSFVGNPELSFQLFNYRKKYNTKNLEITNTKFFHFCFLLKRRYCSKYAKNFFFRFIKMCEMLLILLLLFPPSNCELIRETYQKIFHRLN